MGKLEIAQNKAMRAMTGAMYNDPSSPLFKRLNILKLKDLFEQVKLFMYDFVNKAIRDGKYLARHMPVLGNVHPIKIKHLDIFFVTSFLSLLEFLYF